MAKEKILELDIDIESIISKSKELKSDLDGMRTKMTELKKSGDTSSEGFIKLEASIKKTSAEFNVNQKLLTNLATSGGNYLTVLDKVNVSLDKEVVSITSARNNNAELLKIRNELNLKTAEGAKANDLINAKIDENNKFIKENVSEQEKQQIGIGDYKTAITDALNETGLFSGVMNEFNSVSSATSKIYGLLKNDFSAAGSQIKNSAAETEGMSAAQKGLTIATNIGTGAMRIFALALAATGIGIIIAAVVLLIGYFKTFDPVVDAIEQGMAGLGAAVRTLQQFLVGLFTDMKKLGDFIAHPIDSLRNLGNEMAKTAGEAANLKAAQQDLADQQAIQSVANKKQEAEIARLMLQSKDRGKTEAERIALLQKAEALNQSNFKANAALADQEYAQAVENARIKGALSQQEIDNLQKVGIAYAYKLLNVGKITQEEVDMLTKAEESKIGIFNRSTAEQEKIQNRQNALIEKQQAAGEAAAAKRAELAQKVLDDALAKSQAELDLFLSQQGVKAKSLEDQLAIAEKVRDKQLEIAQKEFDASKKTEADKLKLQTAQNNAKNDFLKAQADTVVANADRELQIVTDKNKAILDSDKFLSEELLKQRTDALNNIATAEREHQKVLFDEGVINKQAYDDAIKKIDDDTKKQSEALDKQRKESKQAADLIDLQNKRDLDQQTFNEQLEIDLAKMEIQKQQELDNAEKTGADKAAIEAKYGQIEKDLRADVENAKLSLATSFLSQAKGLLKEHTLLAKTLGIAEAIINTYLGATKALAELPPPFGAIQAGITIATGMANVAKIGGVKLAKGGWIKKILSKGGIMRGPSHEQGGIDFTVQGRPGFNMEGDEIILTKGVARNPHLRALASYANVQAGGVAFAGGGIPYPTSIVNSVTNQMAGSSMGIDYDLLAEKMAAANMNLPAPRLALEDFNSQQNKYVELTDGANL